MLVVVTRVEMLVREGVCDENQQIKVDKLWNGKFETQSSELEVL